MDMAHQVSERCKPSDEREGLRDTCLCFLIWADPDEILICVLSRTLRRVTDRQREGLSRHVVETEEKAVG